MNTLVEKNFLTEVAERLELPDFAYEKAEERYKDIGTWLCREDSTVRQYSPHIFPQGSFRLGTANKPLNEQEEYDLDLACKLEEGISKQNFTQSELKKLTGKEIDAYRVARGINKEMEEKKRCWRLEYADHIKFHMDIVPCIPEDELQRQLLKKAILLESRNEFLSESVANSTVAITDTTHPKFNFINNVWNVSNPEGYARWFESRMKLASELLEGRAKLFKSATIDKIPNYKWKTPLQMCIQLLKRHRDIMFKNDSDIKPISIIITTLAARAYQGETDLVKTVLNILGQMGNLVRMQTPRVPNPVNPNEDFTDKWYSKEGQELQLEQNFWSWLSQANIDFEKMCSSKDATYLTEQARIKFAIRVDKTDLAKSLGFSINSPTIMTPKSHIITEKSKPWQNK